MKYQIIPYSSRFKSQFKSLNQEWLEKYFYVEEFDLEVLNNPEQYLIKPGGQIYFATVENQAVGTVGLMPNQSFIEITKMAVDPKFRGYGIGQALFNQALKGCGELGYKRVHIFTNTKLHTAFRMYRKMGFTEIPFNTNQYARCNSRLEKYISKALTPHELKGLVEDYLYSGDILRKLVKSLENESLSYHPKNGGWTIEEQLIHLVDFEVVAYLIIKRFLNEETSSDFNWSSNSWIENSNKKTLDKKSLLELFMNLRQANYRTLNALDVHLLQKLKTKINGESILLLDWLLEAKNHNHFGQITRNHEEYLKG